MKFENTLPEWYEVEAECTEWYEVKDRPEWYKVWDMKFRNIQSNKKFEENVQSNMKFKEIVQSYK